MSDQIALAGFEEPHEKELSAYRDILPTFQAAATAVGADPREVKIKHGKLYSSVWYSSILAFRLKLRKGTRYIEVPLDSRAAVQDIGPMDRQKEMSDGFWRVRLGNEPVSIHADALAIVLQDAIDRLPKEWDCCSRYMECSNAKRCVHPDPTLALKCGYRKILASGKIYYGENRNVDG